MPCPQVKHRPSLITVDGVVWDVSNLCSRKYKPSRQKRRSSMSDFDERKRLHVEHMYPIPASIGDYPRDIVLTRTSSWPKLDETRSISSSTTESTEDTHNTICASLDSDLSLEVAPGSVKKVHGAEETSQAIDDGRVFSVVCLACQESLLCIDCASLVLCPTCKCLTPVDQNNVSDGSGGIGLGAPTQNY